MLLDEAVCRDKGIAALSPEAAVLFFLLLPKLNCHGKMEGDIYAIKGLCCRYVEYITIEKLPGLLREISRTTSVKWWEDSRGHFWIHALRYPDYNKNLRKDRMGKDKLPSYQNEELPGVLRSEGKEEGKGEVEGEGKGEGKEKTLKKPPIPPSGDGESRPRRFIPPSVEEVGEECRAHGYPLDAEEWVSYWQSCGWKMGSGKGMRDWRAALLNRAKAKGWKKPSPPPSPEPPTRPGTFTEWGVPPEERGKP